MNVHEEIVSLIQTLGTTFRILPGRIESRLNALTEEQKLQLLELLRRVSAGSAEPVAAESCSPHRMEEPASTVSDESAARQEKSKELPDPNTYDAVSDRSAICRGCPSGCELRWDEKGNYSGFSCIVGQETAGLLAEYYRDE